MMKRLWQTQNGTPGKSQEEPRQSRTACRWPRTRFVSGTRTYNAQHEDDSDLRFGGGHITLEKGIWRGTFAIVDLQKWVHFYRQQNGVIPRTQDGYVEDVKALEALAAELRWRQ